MRETTLDVFMKKNDDKAEKWLEEKKNVKGLYDLPEGWKWVRIKNIVVEFQSGFPCSKIHAVESGIPHLRPNNIGFYGKLDLSRLVFMPHKIVDLNKYSLKKGDVLFNNTNSKELVGRACLVEKDLNYAFSNHITRIRVNKQLITPKWLVFSINYLWLRGYFLSICRKWIGQAGVNTTMLKSTKIPLPPLEEQKRIVSRIEEILSRVEEAKKLKAEARKDAEAIMQAALHGVFSKAEEKRWELKRLKEICKINPSKSEIRNLPNDLEVTFVPMKAVSEITGKIEEPTTRLLGEVRKGFTYFRENDVLFAKITPCMENGKSAIARNLVNGIGFGSTEFHVIRPLKGITPEWIYYFIRQKPFRDLAARNMTGTAGQQRVPKGFLGDVKIPVPSLDEQKLMVSYLSDLQEKVLALRKMQEQTEKILENITPVVLDRAFRGEL